MKRLSLISLLLCLAIASPAGAERLGLSSLSTFPDWTVEGVQAGVEFSAAVATAGDVNGDGFADVIVGASKYDNGIDNEGAAFVYYGGAGGVSDTHAWMASSGNKGSLFGSAVDSAGDVNGDGYDDVIIGAYRYNNGQPEEGAVFVYYGSSAGLSLAPGWMVESNVKETQLGCSVGGAGDINRDGYDDVVVGAKTLTNGQETEGAVYVYYGSPAGLKTSIGWSYESNQPGAMLGHAVGGAGDVNGDGYADIFASAPWYDNGAVDEGRVMVFLGSAFSLNTAPEWFAEGDQQDARFGSAAHRAGDVNGDGYDDLIVGAWQYDKEQVDEGAAFVYLGSPNGLGSKAAWSDDGNQSGEGFGISVGSVGDTDQDGFDEVVVGAHLYSLDQPTEGAVFVYRGSPIGPSEFSAWKAGGNKNETWFGYSTGAAGDVNRDGCHDLIVGAPLYKLDEKTILGRAFIYHGLPGSGEYWYSLHLPALWR